MGGFSVIPEFPGFEINRAGEVRHKGSGKVITPSPRRGGTLFVRLFNKEQDATFRSVPVTLVEVFGAGAAEAAGFAEPDMRRAMAARGARNSGRATGKRGCHDCGRKTTQYRCNRCWRKLRGFGFGDERCDAAAEGW